MHLEASTAMKCADRSHMLPRFTDKDSEMTNLREFLKPAAIAALILFAAATSASPAAADDQASFDTSELSSAGIEEISKEQARQANELAVEEAARAVEADAKLELDIRLIGRTSVQIAGEI